MAMPRKIKVEFGEAFPYGALAVGEPQPLRDFDRSTPDKTVQAVDEESGLPMWSVDILDADPAVSKTARSLAVKLISEYCPVLPDLPAGTPSHLAFMRPVEFEGLLASPYVADSPGGSQKKGRLAWSFRASGMKTPDVGATGSNGSESSAGAGANGKSAKTGGTQASADSAPANGSGKAAA